MLGRVEGESWDIIGVNGVSNETSSGVGVKSDHKEECEVVGVPKCLEALAADIVVGGRVHDEHDKQHEVASNATSLFVVNVLRSNLTDLCTGYQREGIPGGMSEKNTHGSSRH